MSTSTNMHSRDGWVARSTQIGLAVWVTIDDGERNDVTFFFKDAAQADRVAFAFNYRNTETGESE